MESYTVLLSKNNENHEEKACKMQRIIDDINTRNCMPTNKMTWNDDIYQFVFFGSMVDGLECMQNGAMTVGLS